MKLLLTVLALAVALAACGADKPTPEAQVRATLRTFATAVERRDYSRLCDDVLAPSLTKPLQERGLPCEAAMRTSFGQVRGARLAVQRVFVKGTNAEARVRTTATGQAPSTDTVQLTRLKQGWRVIGLGGGAQRPSPTPTEAP